MLPDKRSGIRSLRIFIAEDDPAILELLRVRLELAGYVTFFARDGEAAIDGICNIKPDCVILDIGLPKQDGFAVLRTLRSHNSTRSIPVLMLTARNDAADVKQALADGAQDYLAKPFDDQNLLARVARLLGKKMAAAPRNTSQVWEL